jgi:tetratricopeptide (TPR) repeat protein
MGQWAAAEGAFRAALQLAEERGDDQYVRFLSHNLGLPAMMRGDFSEALRWLRHVVRGEDAHAPLPQEATAYLNIARCHIYRGELDAAERHLDRAHELCRLFNLASVRGEIYETYGNLYRERGDSAHATEFYERAARAYDDAGIEITRRELLEEQALLWLQEGDHASARATIDRLVRDREASGDELGRMTAGLTLGRLLLAQGDAGAARAELERALAYFRAYSLYYYEAQASMALTTCDWLAGREREMFEHLERTLDLAARYDYDYWLRREVAADSRVFAHAEAADLLPPDVRAHLQAVPAVPRETAGVRSARSGISPSACSARWRYSVTRPGRSRRTPGPRSAPATSCASWPPARTAGLRRTSSWTPSGARPNSRPSRRTSTRRSRTSARRSTAGNPSSRTSSSTATGITCSTPSAPTASIRRSSTG